MAGDQGTVRKSDPKVRLLVWERDGGICAFCQKPVRLEWMDLDHIQPRALGGADTVENLRPTHPTCNRSAGTGLGRNPDRFWTTPYTLNLRIPVDLSERIKVLAGQLEHSQHWVGQKVIGLGLDALEAQQRPPQP